MPWMAIRTFEKVKSSPMMPRQPDVPNLIIRPLPGRVAEAHVSTRRGRRQRAEGRRQKAEGAVRARGCGVHRFVLRRTKAEAVEQNDEGEMHAVRLLPSDLCLPTRVS